MEKLIPQVISWAEERNIVRGSDLEKETLKLVYKCGKLAGVVQVQAPRALAHPVVVLEDSIRINFY